MTNLNLGIFSDRNQAEAAVSELVQAGHQPQEISIVVKDTQTAQKLEAHTGASVASGVTSGALTGGVIGGLAGLLAGVGAITIPGLGPLLFAGPIATALGLTGAAAATTTGVIGGAVAGGLVGGLVGLGVPKETAEEYEKEIKAGGILLAVPTREGDRDNPLDILQKHGASNLRVVPMAF